MNLLIFWSSLLALSIFFTSSVCFSQTYICEPRFGDTRYSLKTTEEADLIYLEIDKFQNPGCSTLNLVLRFDSESDDGRIFKREDITAKIPSTHLVPAILRIGESSAFCYSAETKRRISTALVRSYIRTVPPEFMQGLKWEPTGQKNVFFVTGEYWPLKRLQHDRRFHLEIEGTFSLLSQ